MSISFTEIEIREQLTISTCLLQILTSCRVQ